MSAAGQLTYAWDLLHPVAGWSLRTILAAMLLTLAVRTARNVVPSLDGLVLGTEPVSLVAGECPATGNERGAVWQHVWAALGLQPQGDNATATAGGQELLAYPRLGRRLASQLRNVGLILMIAAALVMWAGARAVVSPALLVGTETPLPALAGAEPLVVRLQASESDDRNGKPSVTVLWSQEKSTSSAMTITDSRWRLHRGFWVRIADVVPAIWLRALGNDGSPLLLQPVVGDRQGVSEYRAVLEGEEEQVLTVPEARNVLRISAMADHDGKEEVVIEVLDGGLGTVIDRMRLPGDTTLRVAGMTLDAGIEHAFVLTMWQLPGLALLMLGAVMAIAGAVVRRFLPPWRAWFGLIPAGRQGEWQLLLATDPDTLAELLASCLRTV